MIKIDDWLSQHENRDQGVMLVVGFLDSRASVEGFVEFNRARAAWKLRYPNTAAMEADLIVAQGMGLIADLVIGRDKITLKMLEPRARYQVQAAEIDGDMFGVSATVYAEIMRYWNQVAARNEKRLVSTKNVEPSVEQCADIKRAWQNTEFRMAWKRSIRVLAVSSYYDGRRVSFKTWIGRNREKTTLFALQALRMFEELKPSLTMDEHLILYPEPKGWSMTTLWRDTATRSREAIYESMERTAKQAI